MKLLGKQRYNEGLTAIFELLQYEQLNKQVSVLKTMRFMYTASSTLLDEHFKESQTLFNISHYQPALPNVVSLLIINILASKLTH